MIYCKKSDLTGDWVAHRSRFLMGKITGAENGGYSDPMSYIFISSVQQLRRQIPVYEFDWHKLTQFFQIVTIFS